VSISEIVSISQTVDEKISVFISWIVVAAVTVLFADFFLFLKLFLFL
jgi:hypothetical protein